MSGLVGLERLSGFGDLVGLFFAAITGWAHTISNWVWSMVSGARLGGGSWLYANWAKLLAALVILGLALDWTIWMLRWQPYKLWFRTLRRRRARSLAMAAPKPDTILPADTPDMAAGSADDNIAPDTIYEAADAPISLIETDETDPVAPLADVVPLEDYYASGPVEPIPDTSYDTIYEPVPESDYEPIYEPVLETEYDGQQDFTRDIPLEPYQPALMFEAESAERAPRWPWRWNRKDILRTLTGKPAQRRGLFRLAGDDDEAIAGLPPMIPQDEGYLNPAMPSDPESPDMDNTGMEL
ncbi:MAG: hypothetical protein LBS11_12170 [Oscillospiraceae bacterium]|nr:hypothetical protein [Oscillospiraceae bacterium]